ncbi:nucleotide sugar dehydrogenase [Fulvivirga maritima]|uniref:nucleotide sugar dehydrogenase n=1 Tax=Fulvivirga maritima TaxID=2904247 RepID=UPI001F3938FF|nr:nucleotide sugar dehydrogenase [Fulvivirga maritima]UII27955.1 nucleotide sugar dehydrogenase [Fulvivirga maritima]
MSKNLAIIGLGYVGLPLAVEFGKKVKVVGFDINKTRIEELKKGFDRTKEVDSDELNEAQNLTYSSDINDLNDVDIYIVTVPTPIDQYKKPDLTPLEKASATVGKSLKKGDIVIYESTVFPGCTEEVCVPILEEVSGLKFNDDFYCGYSPERINPGDKVHRLPSIKKVTSGSTPEVAEEVDQLYKTVITAGTHKASSIKVAEAAKVIENSQRDLNIAFVNELALIFDKIGIDTHEVLEAAGTKWNFLNFKPGLVGGHCIGVDPYYLTYKAESYGYNPQVILSGRRINDNMGMFVANKVIKLMTKKDNPINNSNILVLGITFKENCPDIRNSRVIDVIRELQGFGANVEVFDPEADKEEVKHEYDIDLIEKPNKKYNAIVLAVSHDEFKDLDMSSIAEENTAIYDIKGYWNRDLITARL